MADEQLDRLVAAQRAQTLILQGLAAVVLSGADNPAEIAREMRAVTGDKFADAVPSGRMDREREARVNHLSAHFAESFWTGVEETLRKTSLG